MTASRAGQAAEITPMKGRLRRAGQNRPPDGQLYRDRSAEERCQPREDDELPQLAAADG